MNFEGEILSFIKYIASKHGTLLPTNKSFLQNSVTTTLWNTNFQGFVCLLGQLHACRVALGPFQPSYHVSIMSCHHNPYISEPCTVSCDIFTHKIKTTMSNQFDNK